MKQCSHGLRSSALSPSKSEQEDSIFADYTLDLSFLSSDDSLPRHLLHPTNDGQLLEEERVLLNPNPLVSKLPEMLIDPDKLGLSFPNTALLSEKSSTEDDSEEDVPCWIGINSRSTLPSGAKFSTDDLSGFRRLNPLAPQFVPSSSKKMHLEKDGGTSSSPLKKSLSLDFPSSSSRDDAASILTHNVDESLGFVSQDCVSGQQPKRLDPLAPLFVPSSAKLSPRVHEKQEAFGSNVHSTSAYSDNKSLGKVKVDTSSAETGRIHISGSSSSYKPRPESKVRITESAKLGSSSSKSHGQRRLNPLAPQFSLADTKPKPYSYADDLSLVVNTEHNVVDANFAQSSTYVERFLPNMSHGGSTLISPNADNNFGSAKWYAVEPNTTLSVNGSEDFQHPLPFHIVETAASSSSNNVNALSGSSPKIDVKKLLTTIHGLSELLTLAHGSESSDAEEHALINSTVQNLNLYIQNGIQEQAMIQSVVGHNSHDLKLLPTKSKLSIRDLQLPRTNNMNVDLDVRRKEKYSVVSGDTFSDSGLYQYGVTKDNVFGQVVGKRGYQQNHQGEEEQINQHALFYKSLWLKAEADRCLMVYETSLSNPGS